MTSEQIEATRPAFERFYSDDGNWPKSVERKESGSYELTGCYLAWIAWKAAKADAVLACQLCADLDHFVQLARQATAEECAQLCHDRVMGDGNREDAEARRCADAIRAKFADKDAITGWPPGLMQDDSRKLSKALANTPGARRMVDEQTKAPDAMPKLPS